MRVSTTCSESFQPVATTGADLFGKTERNALGRRIRRQRPIDQLSEQQTATHKHQLFRGQQARKRVFITTSSFSGEAREYAARIHTRTERDFRDP